MTYRDLDPKLAGIYIFKNNINGKCYIGQAVSLRKRIKHHLSNIKTNRYDLPLYKAINKYGMYNFTIDILYSFIPDKISSTEELIRILDELEVKYIEEYEAYTKGYNCTKGGDFGVLGLKFTEEQKKKVSEKSKINAVKYYKPIYLYHIKEKSTIFAISVTHASRIVGFHRSCITRAADNKYKETHGYIAAWTKEDLEEKVKQIYNIEETIPLKL